MAKKIQVYRHGGIAVSYDPNVCIHAAECARGLPEVFDPREKRWIRPERGDAKRIEAVVARCPTGALKFRREDPAAERTAPQAGEVTIRISGNGPLLVEGRVRVETEAGELVAREDRVALCRCGGTANPPFCDGTHARTGWKPAPGRSRK
jgi:uncharacterized Fe-S cluster protein YjdI/CDGSH-type Zn-finger protein